MFIKLGIIVGIVVLGGMIFSNEIDTLFPSTSATVFDSLQGDLANFGSKASDSVEQRIDESIDKITDKTGNAITNEISEAGDKITSEISEAKESSQKTISEEISNFNPIEAITNIFTGGSSSPSTSSPSTSSPSTSSPSTSSPSTSSPSTSSPSTSSPSTSSPSTSSPSTSSPSTSSPSTSSPSTSSPIIFDTLSLSTKQQADDNILLQYSDSSGKTQSVNVVIRTEQKELFSGIFFSSMFEATVNDATGIPYFIDMVVEHEDHGTITSSVFNPGDASDTNINGIFLQS